MVHIIRQNPTDSSILSRKARYLAEELGWTIGASPDPDAFINYSFPYLDGRNSDVPFIAYFTHREDCLPDKVEIWERRAKDALIRITSAKQYYDDLSQYGPTVRILPPLDRDKFSPRLVPIKNSVPKIGVAGFVYRGGRKGEHLVAEAVKRLPGFEFKAIGSGWPIPTQHVSIDRLHEFYHSIDIFLCTSSIEGIPYPPLEALACGVKVVIPRGVGLLDDIPELAGIERYDVGDIESMIQAIKRVAEIKAKPEDLRETTTVYSIDGWVEAHAKVFVEYENVVAKTTRQDIKRRSDRGIYVVAYGSNARRCARRLLRSIRERMPETEVAVISDKKMPEADYSLTLPEDVDPGGRLAKIKAYEYAPGNWKEVIYLDADTELNESVEFIFWALEQGWEMVLTKDVNSRDCVKHLKRGKSGPEYEETVKLVGSEREMALAGGVWAFRRCAGAKRFLDGWISEWGDGRYRDQSSMLRSFFKNKVRALILGSEWNSFTNHAGENRVDIILHYSGGTARTSLKLQHVAGDTIVINESDKPIERAGLLFMPSSPVLVNKTKPNFAEVKSCQHLRVIQR